jgi:hypothetical protein
MRNKREHPTPTPKLSLTEKKNCYYLPGSSSSGYRALVSKNCAPHTWFGDISRRYKTCKYGSSFLIPFVSMQTAIQALLPLHSIPVRFYTKAGREQNTDCNKYVRLRALTGQPVGIL